MYIVSDLETFKVFLVTINWMVACLTDKIELDCIRLITRANDQLSSTGLLQIRSLIKIINLGVFLSMKGSSIHGNKRINKVGIEIFSF